MKGDNTRSPLLPGGDLVSALFDREVMGLADRGGASNLIGDRWADIAAAHVATWIGTERRLHGDDQQPLHIVRVDRLDATPAVAAAASKRGLQNPDLLLIGQRGNQQAIQAADAKFSVETARSKQVSPEVVLGLLELREPVSGLLEGSVTGQVESGVFLCPDYPLTHLMLRTGGASCARRFVPKRSSWYPPRRTDSGTASRAPRSSRRSPGPTIYRPGRRKI